MADRKWTAEDYGYNPVFRPAAVSAADLQDFTGSRISTTPNPGVGQAPYANIPGREAAQVANVLASPQNVIGKSPKTVTQSWIERLFDTSDASDNPVESVWDGMLRGLTWTYDRMAQAESLALSALPGGVDTFTWQQAGQISPGQTVVGNIIHDYNRFTGAENDFNILDEAQREQVFKENLAGKIASGTVDLGLSLFVDPFFVAGKAAKVARLRYVDKMYTTEQELKSLATSVDDGIKAVQAGAAVEEVHPVAQAVIWATEKTADGGSVRTLQDFANHQVFGKASNIEAMAATMMAADTPEQGALALRYMLGDMSVIPALKKERADILDDISTRHRQVLQTVLQANPKLQAKQIEKYSRNVQIAEAEVSAVRSAAKAMYGNTVDINTVDEVIQAERQLWQQVENLNTVKNFELPDPAQMTGDFAEINKQAVKDAAEALKVARDRDRFFQKALAEEESNVTNIYGILRNKDRGFSSDTAFGRMVEQSRQGRAVKASRQQGTRRAMNAQGEAVRLWQKDVYGTPGLTRMTNLWRWVGNELPSGRISLVGAAAQGSSKELMAVLNDVAIYSGEQKIVKIAKEVVKRDQAGKAMRDAAGNVIKEKVEQEVFVGGAARKDEILRQFAAASGNTATDVAMRKRLIDSLENAITNDLAMWYGMSPQDMAAVTGIAKSKRDQLIEHIKNVGYWVDEKGHQNKAPFLETHLENATYMLNFRSIERAIAHHQATGLKDVYYTGKNWTTDRLLNLYQTFNEVWRPATLLRLGYTQRNVVEGLARSTAFMFSVNPKHYSAASTDVANVLSRTVTPAKNLGKGVAAGSKNITSKFVVERQAALVEKLGPQASKKFMGWHTAQVKAAADDIDTLEAIIKEFTSEYAEAVAAKDEVLQQVLNKNLKYFNDRLEGAKYAGEALNDPAVALQLFREQGKSKMRLYSGETDYNNLNPFIRRDAFNDKNGYAEIAWRNMSSDGNRRLEAMLAADGMSHIWKRKAEREFVTVRPGDSGYFDGVARVLMQFKNSSVGEMILAGKPDIEVATYLRKNPTGRNIAEFIGLSRPAGENGFSIVSMEDAMEYVSEMRSRLSQIAPNPDVLKMARTAKHIDGDMVKPFLDGRKDLVPVIGNYATDLGTNKLFESYRKLSHIGFRYLGTLPEDALVRGPFYGQRYGQIRDDLLDTYLAQTPKGQVDMRAINKIHAMAHQGALADTKKWLYTIDRRTNLGQLGEYIFPFISASQNSITTFGRLIWNDPRVGAALVKLWQAPQKMGWEDEEGNIVLPLPHSLIPDAVEKAVGLDNMLNMKVSKNGLNVIFPMVGETPLPSPGPMVAVTASELMKHGWFGQSISAPNLLVSALGEETANDIWDLWKATLFGQQGSISKKVGSWDMILPPWMQKAIQMKDGELNSSAYAYQYALQMRTEQAKYIAGYRDSAPTADEITKRTNGLYMLRILGNLTAFTPPQYVSKLQPLIDAVKFNKDTYGDAEGTRVSAEQFGEYLLMLGDFDVSKNVAGALASTTAYANARKYESLIGRVAPEIGDDLSVLGIILNTNAAGNTELMYDPSVSAWQYATNIPGVTRKYREMQSPQEALIESQKNAGWIAYIKGMDVLDAIRQQRGLKSFRSAAAKDLKAQKDQLIARLASDPSFAGWYSDYQDFGSSRARNAVKVLEAALTDPKFVSDNATNSIWTSARVYLQARQEFIDGRITSDDWDNIRGGLIDASPAWGAIANRYLSGDDDPAFSGVSFATMGG